MSDGNAPEAPEALAERILELCANPPDKGDVAALIAQHTAELTATSQRHLEERDHYRGCYLEMVTTRGQWQERISGLEAQLAASAQREASARAEALKEAESVVCHSATKAGAEEALRRMRRSPS